ncbi:MAG TPA: sulfotransferase [Caulobacter sp.]|nr:sulfotransferase [Caulobacter sp.]
MVRMTDLLNQKKPSIGQVYELVREVHRKAEALTGEHIRRFDELDQGLAEQRCQREMVATDLRDEISNLAGSLGQRMSTLEGDIKIALDSLGGKSVSLAAAGVSRLDYFRGEFDAMDAFLRWARAEDRRQMDAIGTIAKRTEEFLRFARADDRAQLDQVGILADNVHSRLANVLSEHEEAFRDLRGLAEALSQKLDGLDQRMEGVDRKVGALCRPLDGDAIAASDLNPISRRGLFVVGHARAGTTILQTALNTSPDVLLFGEANFHFHAREVGFRDWYNHLHGMFGAPHLKSTYCPKLLAHEATGLEYLQKLAANYRWVGEKIAFGAASEDFGFESFSDFHEREFYDAHYICIMKHPFGTLISNKTMFKPRDMRPYVRSFVRTLAKIVEISSIHPNVRVLIHEQITAETFEKLSEFLSIPLDEAFPCYVADKQNHAGHDDAVRVLGDEYSAIVERAWLRFLEFYDPEALIIREQEGRLAYLLVEYAEVVAAIDHSLAESLAAETRREAQAKAAQRAARRTKVVKVKASNSLSGQAPVKAVAEASPVVKTKKPTAPQVKAARALAPPAKALART